MTTRAKLIARLTFVLGGAAAAFARDVHGNAYSMCGATHMAKDKTPADSTRMCVKDGVKYALAAGKKLYTLEGNEPELAKPAGQKVTVKGTLKSDTLSVQEVAASK